MLRRLAWIAVTAITLAAVATDVPELLRGPAPYPPEWQWLRREDQTSGRFGPVLACGVLLLAVLLASGRASARRRPIAAARSVLAASSVLGVALSVSLLALEPTGAVDTLYGRVVYRTATSYYTVAIAPEAADPVGFVARHHELLPALRTAAKHAATHPPGPVLYYRAILAACEASPRLTHVVLAAAGLPETNPRRPRPEHTSAARAAAVLGGTLTLVLCALVVWPVAALARALGASPMAAARVGALWAVLPGPLLMAPMLDQLVALPAACAAATLAGIATAKARGETRRVWILVAAAGLCGGLATLLSYGAAAFLAIAGLAALALGLARGARPMSLLGPMAAAAVLALLTFVAPALAGHRPFTSARVALDLHREFFTAPRQYGVWLVFNLVDAALFVGPPVALAVVLRLLHATRRLARGRVVAGPEAYALGAAAGLAVLLLSGVTRGEVGRLWIPLMPIVLVAALAGDVPEGDAERPLATDIALLAALLMALDVALRVSWRIPS